VPCLQINPLVKTMWEAFKELVASLHEPAPVPADCSTYVNIVKFAEVVRIFTARQSRLKLLFHLCYDDQTWAVYIHAGCDHMPLYYAYHLTLGGLSQGPLEYFHNITRNLQQLTFTKSPLATFKQELRRLYSKIYAMLPEDVRSACEEYAEYGAKVRTANKAYTDAVAMVCTATDHHSLIDVPLVCKVTFVCWWELWATSC
jgi:hypothetical protein